MAKILTLPANTIEINKVSLSEHGMLDRDPRTASTSLENSGDPIYSTELEITVNTQALYNKDTGTYGNPLMDLSEDMPLGLLVIYSKNETDDFDPDNPTQLLVSDDTFYEMRRLTHPVRSATGDLLTEIVKNPEKMREQESEINIQYSFRFTRNFEGFFAPGESQNIKIIVVPFLFPKMNDATPISEMNATRFATPLSLNVLRNNQIPFDTFPLSVGSASGTSTSVVGVANAPVCDLREDFYQVLFNFDVLNANYPKKAISSELFASYGKRMQVKGAFAISRPDLLKNRSQFGNFLYNKGVTSTVLEEIIALATINELKLTRQQVKDSRGFSNEAIKVSNNAVPKLIVSTTESGGSLKLAKRYEGEPGKSKILAEVRELSLDGLPSMIIFNDYDVSYRGKHVYSVKMNMVDGIRLYLGSLLDSLETARKTLDIYYGLKYKLRSRPTNEEDVTRAAVSIADTIRVLNDMASDFGDSLNTNLVNLTKYEQSFSNLITFVDTLIAKLYRMLNKRQYNLSKSTNSTKNLLKRSIIDYTTTFSDYVDFEAFSALDYDYVGVPSQANLGMSLISAADLKKRFQFEFEKMISTPGENFAELSTQIFSDTEGRDPTSTLEKEYFNLESKYYTFLAPIQLGTTKLTKQNIFNNEIFNEFHVRAPSKMVLTSKMALSYLMQTVGIALGGMSFDLTTKKTPSGGFVQDAAMGDRSKKDSSSKKETYTDVTNYFSSTDKMASTTSMTPPPDLRDFDGPTDTREKYASFVNAILKQEESWDLDRQTFGTVSLGRNYEENLPNHMRVLFGSKSDACRNKWLLTEDDYFSNPDTYYMIKQNYMNLARIQTVRFRDGDLKQPIYQDLSKASVESGQPLICRVILEDNQKFKIGTGFGQRNYTNKYFIMLPNAWNNLGSPILSDEDQGTE